MKTQIKVARKIYHQMKHARTLAAIPIIQKHLLMMDFAKKDKNEPRCILMYEKLCAILDELHRRYGYDAHAVGDSRGWFIHVDYIEEGPRFDYEVGVDSFILKHLAAEEIAEYIKLECQSAVLELEGVE